MLQQIVCCIQQHMYKQVGYRIATFNANVYLATHFTHTPCITQDVVHVLYGYLAHIVLVA